MAVDNCWGIGRDGCLLFHIPEDMRLFREYTRGKTVVMGRATLQSLPGGAPLKNRRNIVLSGTAGFAAEGAAVCGSLAGLAAVLAGAPKGEVWVIGGEQVYRLLLPFCSRAYVTRVHADGEADRFFPNIDADPAWALREQSEQKHHGTLGYRFCVYQNLQPQRLAAK